MRRRRSRRRILAGTLTFTISVDGQNFSLWPARRSAARGGVYHDRTGI
jgi:hypothetical protein